MAYLISGLFFLVFPGTFLGVWNLFDISTARSAGSVSPTWIQAHGHAQLFGWISSFILGIGFYSIPDIRRDAGLNFRLGWLIWLFWTVGVTLRWLTNVYAWCWLILLPLSAVLELLAVILFIFCSIRGHRTQLARKSAIEDWTILVFGGTIGLAACMSLNAFECFRLSLQGSSVAFSTGFDSRYLFLCLWGFPVPIAWGFTAHWMPVILGLKPLKSKLILPAFALGIAGVSASMIGALLVGSILVLISSILIVLAFRILETSLEPPKLQGVHGSFPIFMRLAYVWLVAAGLIGVWAGLDATALGIGGAGRHALTVGFLMTMVFSVAPRMLPAFLGKKKIFSALLMFVSLLLANIGCAIRVMSEIVAYQYQVPWAWSLLPISATLEMTGVAVFTLNMVLTICVRPTFPLAQQTCSGTNTTTQSL